MSVFLRPIRLTAFQKAVAIPYFAINSILDPTRGDMVAALGDSTGIKTN